MKWQNCPGCGVKTQKRFCAWAHEHGMVAVNPGTPAKLVPRVPQPPRQLSDQEEAAMHTGLRAEELCGLRPQDVAVSPRSSVVHVYGRRNEYREVPLNSTARDTLRVYLATLQRMLAASSLAQEWRRGG